MQRPRHRADDTAPSRRPEGRRRAFLRGDDAVEEVVGFILMFGISAMILVVSLQGFQIAQDHADRLLARVEMTGLANRVSSRVVQAVEVSQSLPNATYVVSMQLPDQIGVYDYTVEARPDMVYVNSTNDQVRASATTLRTEAISDLAVSGDVHSSELVLKLTYRLTAAGEKTITITGG